MSHFDSGMIHRLMRYSQESITLTDMRLPGFPLAYVNPAFETMTGYGSSECIGRNCQFLYGNDRAQPELKTIGESFSRKQPCLVVLRNYRKDGSMYWNELSLTPICNDDGELTHFLGIHKDITFRKQQDETLSRKNLQLEETNRELDFLASVDGLTGVFNRRFFDNKLQTQWDIARHNHVPLSLFMIDIDHFKEYNDCYGHQAGDECLQMVSQEMMRIFRRTSDHVARYGGEEFVVLAYGMPISQALEMAEELRLAIKSLGIPHSGSRVATHLTVSVGVASFTPGHQHRPDHLLARADRALYRAKTQGRDRTIFSAPDHSPLN